MCLAPSMLPNGVPVGCRECWQCRARAINDWVGRNIAEASTSVGAHAVTLTYGRNQLSESLHDKAVWLTYRDVQKFLKLARFHGYPVRYFVTGEYGSRKGRAHWHIMLYWQERVPEVELDQNVHHPWWPEGFSFWTKPTHHAVRYNCKYVQKGMKAGDDFRQGHLSMSKKPPLGTAFFADLAAKYVKAGLAPQTLEYSFPDVLGPDGRPLKFFLGGTPAANFLRTYIQLWQELRGGHWPNSELVDLFHEYGRVVRDESLIKFESRMDFDLWAEAVAQQKAAADEVKAVERQEAALLSWFARWCRQEKISGKEEVDYWFKVLFGDSVSEWVYDPRRQRKAPDARSAPIPTGQAAKDFAGRNAHRAGGALPNRREA